MADDKRTYNSNWLLGCGLVGVVALLCLGAIFVLGIRQDRQAAQYPGALPISSHSNYSGLPFQFKWDNTYQTTDNFTAVYQWYSITFDLGAETRAHERCILLEGADDYLVLTRYTSVFLCNTSTGQMIFVTRSTSLN